MPRVIVYKGTFAYDAVNIFIEELGEGFTALGYEVDFVDIADEARSKAQLQEALSRPFVCILSFGAIGVGTISTAEYDQLPAPFVAILVDHPSVHLPRFAMKNIIFTCYDRSHTEFLKRYFKGRKRVEFLPHGGSFGYGDANGSGNRPINVLFPGTYADADEAYTQLRTDCTHDIFDIMDLVVERLLIADGEPIENVLSTVLTAEGKDDEWRRLCIFLPTVDWFVKAYKRMKVLKRLDDAGVAVNILGNGWPHDVFKYHKMMPALKYRQVLSLMRRSKIVLNMGFVPDGSHERVFSAMLNGALAASDNNVYLNELFLDGKEILLFRSTEIDQLPGRIADVLDDEAKLSECSIRASELAQAHTWSARAASILDLITPAGHRK